MKALCKVWAIMQAFLSLGSYDPADPVKLEESMADRDAERRLWQALMQEPQGKPLRFTGGAG